LKTEQTLEHWPLERFIDYARNPRKNDHAVDKVASAIREFGFRVPVVAKSDGTVVDGMSVPPKMTEQVARAVIDQWLQPLATQ